jgi:hypothetical protein
MREPEVLARLAPLQMQTRHGDRATTEAYFMTRWPNGPRWPMPSASRSNDRVCG